MRNVLKRIIDWLTGPSPRTHLFVIRHEGRVLLRMDFKMLMFLNELNDRQSLIVDLDFEGGKAYIRINDNMNWRFEPASPDQE